MKSFSKKPVGRLPRSSKGHAVSYCPIYGTPGGVRVAITTKNGTITATVHPLAKLMRYRLKELAL